MKDYTRADTRFSLCGLNCALCPIHQMVNGCPGCGGGDGHQSCPICRCAKERGEPDYCFECDAYPCEKHAHFDDFDSFVPHRQAETFARAREIGLETYLAELDEKADLLRLLLDEYNDGRRKSFFCTAMNLLPAEDIRAVREQLAESTPDAPVKEKAALAVRLLQNAADGRKLSLKLRKKPRKQEN